MNTCPFCQKSISEELTLHGGHCPHCLIEIPGEESVTDPGVVDVESSAKAHNGGSSVGAKVALVASVLVGAGVAVWFQSAEPEPVAPIAKVGTPIPLSAHEDQPFALPADDANALSPAKRSQPRRKSVKRVSAGTAPPPMGQAVTRDAAVVPASGSTGLGSAPRDVFSTIGAAPRSRAQESIVLKDALQIEEMIGRVLNRGAKQMEQCYNQALKLQPGLKGDWYVDFTITPEGKPEAVNVTALGASNASIEGCIDRRVSRWRFQRVAEHVDVARTYKFGT